MKQLVILSGKGGTGKTTVAAALAHLASQEMTIVLADADVDAANLELVLDPTKQEAQDFAGGKLAVIDPEKCTACAVCADVCRFEAIIRGDDVCRVDALACEGCAACYYQCPEQVIRMEEQRDGQWFRSDTRFGPLFHAHLFAGRENSGKLVTLVKQQARSLAETRADLLLVDGLYRLHTGVEQRAIVRGDGRSLSVAAASVVAKVVRDRMMAALDGIYPYYSFHANKGYPTRTHLEALSRHGPCPAHRFSYEPVRVCAERA